MSMKPIPTNILVKLKHAEEFHQKIFPLCLSYLEYLNNVTLEEIGSYLGNQVTNLRSALNYGLRDFAQTELRGFLSNGEFRKLKLDFPSAISRDEFERIRLVNYLKQHCFDFYQFLESVQPYHAQHRNLLYLRKISNIDKHELITEIKKTRYKRISFPRVWAEIVDTNQRFYSGRNELVERDLKKELVEQGVVSKEYIEPILVVVQQGEPYRAYPVPYFLEEPFGLFASKFGWVSFEINVQIEKYEPPLIWFCRGVGRDVKQILLNLYSFM